MPSAVTELLPGYRLGAVLRDTPTTSVYEAVREHDSLPVVARFFSVAAGEAQQARLEHEVRLLCELDVAGVARALELMRAGDRHVLVSERFAGMDLQRFMADRPLDLAVFLDLAIRIAHALAGVHSCRVVHRDLKPISILLEPESGAICLADFGISVDLEQSHRRLYDLRLIEGTLPYISPEQTGRTGRGVDHRSDLYSLGATFYELLSGRRPFETDDPMALIHAHLARKPQLLGAVAPSVPEVLSLIVERLLAKDPADRYQSARSLSVDLESCQAGLVDGSIPLFEIAASDLAETPQLPNRLYGRESELEQLTNAFARARRGGVEILLIRGAPGVGKTALVGEVLRPLTGLGGYFIAGKFEQHRRDTPYQGLRQALSALAELLLVEDEKRLARWRKLILEQVGTLAGVLLELAPRLEGVLGPQNAVAELGPLESRNRLLLAISRLLAVIASPRHPVVLFLDDLQWSDSGSLRLLEYLAVEQGARGLLLIGAYRVAELSGPDSEISLGSDQAHSISRLLLRLESAGLVPTAIELGPLAPEAVTQLIADTLAVPGERAESLALALAGRSQGNPFLLRQLLLFLADEGLLERGPRGWSWSDETVRGAGIPETVVAAVGAKIARLAPELRDILGAASCLGSRIDLPNLAAAMKMLPVELLPRLVVLCEEGLLAESAVGAYRFSHDRIEEAAAAALSPEKARAYHGRVGRFLRRSIAETDLADRAFEIVEHLNECIATEDDPELLLDLARLDHQAGVKAIASTAYAMAERQLAAGIAALERAKQEASGRLEVRPLSLALRLDYARSISLGGRISEASRLFDELMIRVEGDPSAIARICTVRLEMRTIHGDYEAASRWGLEGLASCGLRIPRHPSQGRCRALLWRLKYAFRGDARRRLMALPECSDPQALLRTELLSRMVIPAYMVSDSLYTVVIAHQALHLLRYGRSPLALYPLTGVGSLLGSRLGDADRAGEIARTALELSSGSNVVCRTTMGAYHGSLSWVRPYRACLAALEAAFEVGREEGDVEFAGLLIVSCATFRAVSGLPLAAVARAAERAQLYRARAGLASYTNRQDGLLEMCSELSAGQHVDPEVPRRSSKRAGRESDLSPDRGLWMMQRLMFLNRCEQALEIGDAIASRAEHAFFATHYFSEFVFFHGLSAAACLDPIESRWTGARRRRLFRILTRAHRRQLMWARHCESNFCHKALALAAEIACLRGRLAQAVGLFQQAAQSAEQHGFGHLQALILERLGRRVQACGWHELATAPLSSALHGYSAWGASFKVERLRAEFPELRRVDSRPEQVATAGGRAALAEALATGTTTLDLVSVLKTSQAISEEIRIGRVVEQVMAAAIENAGAQRGVLLLDREGKMNAVAEAVVGQQTIHHDPELPATELVNQLALSVVRLATRTRDAVLVADAAVDGRFTSDPYITDARVRSIACFPIIKQGRRDGLLYLENNLAPRAFTTERADVLRVLASQAAISLENARLYEDLRGARDRLAEQMVEQLRIDASRQRLVAELESSNAELERFIYTASHDLKTPLITIRGFMGMLRKALESDEPEQAESSFRKVEKAAERMYRMLDEMLELARVGRVIRTPEEVPLDDLVAEALERLVAQTEDFSIEIAPGLPSVVVDRARFLEVLQNVLENAIAFMGDQRTPRIEISALAEPERTRISIADNGIGIDPAYHERVFGLFERLDAASPGTGVGLALVRRIVEAHGGRVWVESKGRGYGTRVEIELPGAEGAGSDVS